MWLAGIFGQGLAVGVLGDNSACRCFQIIEAAPQTKKNVDSRDMQNALVPMLVQKFHAPAGIAHDLAMPDHLGVEKNGASTIHDMSSLGPTHVACSSMVLWSSFRHDGATGQLTWADPSLVVDRQFKRSCEACFICIEGFEEDWLDR